MAEFETIRRTGAIPGVRTAAVDSGLRAHMNKVYGTMSVGMLDHGAGGLGRVGFGCLRGSDRGDDQRRQVPDRLRNGDLRVAAEVGDHVRAAALRVRPSAGINRMSAGAAQVAFYVFAAVMGLSISSIFLVFTGMSIVQIFLVTAIAFAGLSLWGYTTQTDLSGWGTFLFMGVIGLVVASIVNIFLGSPAIMFAVSAIGVLIFAGLTAYDTQNIKNTYLAMRAAEGEDYIGRAAILGALSLYLNFINMFMMLLQLFGQRE